MSLLSVGFGAAVLLAMPGNSFAQGNDDYHPLTINVGGGFTAITGRLEGRLDHGGNFQAGAGYFFNPYVGFTGNFMFHQLGITRSALDRLNQPDGNARIYSFTFDPTVRIPIGGRASIYFLAGGGYIRRTVEFTQPTLAQTTIFDPWWGYFGPGLVPVDRVLGSVTTDGGVYNVGGGVNIPVGRSGIKMFFEARYVHGFTEDTHTRIIPITVGIRW
jgi:hypothetical protein